MYEEFFSRRLTQLRMAKGVSAREMSFALGQSPSYINNIENRGANPSMSAFYVICDYFQITPQEFFDEGNPYPDKIRAVARDLEQLDEEAFGHVAPIIKDLAQRK